MAKNKERNSCKRNYSRISLRVTNTLFRKEKC